MYVTKAIISCTILAAMASATSAHAADPFNKFQSTVANADRQVVLVSADIAAATPVTVERPTTQRVATNTVIQDRIYTVRRVVESVTAKPTCTHQTHASTEMRQFNKADAHVDTTTGPMPVYFDRAVTTSR